ncbi:MAG: YbhB/YbcL family Raf kinase inhibitor-like protein [Verrucomicrobiota bacterium]|nr:YbhB/YbcL family Raf kinase inhibitor-like protein [Verrucomicrobiota bacterium]
MKLLSPSFQNGEKIPARYTCDGENHSPPLHIRDVPKEAKSLVLIMDDPDVPAWVRKDQMFDHWVLFNIAPDTTEIAENRPPLGIHGKNSSGENSYVGPCPPDREHRYFFKLYALNKILSLPGGVSKKEVEKAMQGHIIAECDLMGRYDKRHKG